MTRTATSVFICFLLFALLYATYIPVHPDSAYYWTWSRHLAWSYYDGPPLLAYIIRLVQMVFGSSPYVLKCIGVFCVALAAGVVYLLAARMFDQRVALRALISFWLMPVVQATSIATTLDAPLLLCWSLALYWGWRWLAADKLYFLYLTALAMGLGLLAKYSMVLILPSFFFFLLGAKQRQYLLKPHLYLALGLALLGFLPVVIWNARHDWVSFAFQWHHGAAHQGLHWDTFGLYWLGQLGAMNPIFLVLLICGSCRLRTTSLRAERFLWWPCLCVFLFFAYNALYQRSEVNWTLPAAVSVSILLAYYVGRLQWRWLWRAGVIFNIVVMLFLLFPRLSPWLPARAQLVGRFFGYRGVLQQVQTTDLNPQATIVSNSYQNAAEAALYLPGQPQVFVVMPTRVSVLTRQSQSLLQRIQAGEVPALTYIGDQDKQSWLLQYYQQCAVTKVMRYQLPWVQRRWHITFCQQPRSLRHG